MSAIKRFMKDSMERLKVDELLRKELRNSGYGGITMTKTPPMKGKQGVQGITGTIIPPETEFPDKISLEGLPEVGEMVEEDVAPPEEARAHAVVNNIL